MRYKKDGSIRTVYAVGGDRGRTVLLHRVIAGTPVGMETDHRDRDGLNNRRSNLRNATIAQNRQNAAISADNTSGVKGVCGTNGQESGRRKSPQMAAATSADLTQ